MKLDSEKRLSCHYPDLFALGIQQTKIKMFMEDRHLPISHNETQMALEVPLQQLCSESHGSLQRGAVCIASLA